MSKFLSSLNSTSTTQNNIFNNNVGIGTTNPTQQLHITADALIGGGDLFLFDTNEKIASNGTDMFFHVNGSEQMRILSGGNVGIGTNNPTEKLHVVGTIGVFSSDNNQAGYITTTAEAGFNNKINIVANRGSGGIIFTTNPGTLTERMRIANGGNVGIGTTNPLTLFYVAGTNPALSVRALNQNQSAIINLATPGVGLNTTKTSIIASGFDSFSRNHLYFCLNSSADTSEVSASDARMTILNGGNVGIGTNNPSQQLHITADALIGGGDLFLVDTNEKIASDGTDMFFHVNGSERMRILSGGNVGIGTNNPTQQLHITADALIGGGDLFLFDTNEKIASDGTDMFFHVNGSEKVRILSNGNVGIGTNNPVCLFHLYENTTTTTGIDLVELFGNALTTGTVRFKLGKQDSIGDTSEITYTHVGTNNADNRMDLGFHTQTCMSLKRNSNVGIGTTNPVCRGHIKQEATIAGGNLVNYTQAGLTIEPSSSTNKWSLSSNGSDNFTFHYNLTERGYLVNNVNVANIDFTGQHRSCTEENLNSNHYGLIVISSGEYSNMTPGTTNIPSINEALPCVNLSQAYQDKRVFGVISEKEDGKREYTQGLFVTTISEQDANRLIINSLGEGAIWICNKHGVYENGDYITTCSVHGYGAKQSDDLLHNYTVAKITQDENFTNMSNATISRYLDALGNILTEEEYTILLGITSSAYKAKLVGCTYHCG
jgi:ribosomal protein S6E (S10)